MKKILLLVMLMSASVAYASKTGDPCGPDNSGTVFVGADGKTTYCISNQGMNWWTAFVWCDMVGGTMASMDDCALGKNYGQECPQFPREQGGWLDAVPNERNAFLAQWGTLYRRDRVEQRSALCRGNF